MFYDYIPDEVTDKYEFANYNNAVEILANAYQDEWWELIRALQAPCHRNEANFYYKEIIKSIDESLKCSAWKPVEIKTDLHLAYNYKAEDACNNEYLSAEKTVLEYIPAISFDRMKKGIAFLYDSYSIPFNIASNTSILNLLHSVGGYCCLVVILQKNNIYQNDLLNSLNIPMLLISPKS